MDARRPRPTLSGEEGAVNEGAGSGTQSASSRMKAVCIHAYGPPETLVYEDVPRPAPGEGEALVRVAAAGVGPWDAWIREGKSVVKPKLPLVPGSDLSGVVVALGPGSDGLAVGDEVYGVTNAQFTGAYAEYAVASLAMLAKKPRTVTHVEAASLPVVAVTAWRMIFDHARVAAGQTVLVHGAGGNVGAYAVQLARLAGATVIATAGARDLDYVGRLGAERVVDYRAARFEEAARGVDAVIDTVGGEARDRSYAVLKKGGLLVSALPGVDEDKARRHGVRAVFFLVEVTTAALDHVAGLVDAGKLHAHVGEVLPLAAAAEAHRMLAGAPHKPGKIVLAVAG